MRTGPGRCIAVLEPHSNLEEDTAFLNILLGGVGLVTNFIGKQKAAAAESKQYAEQAKIAGENAKIVDAQIVDAFYRGRRKQQDVVTEGRRVAGAQKTRMAASGLDLDMGSPADAIYNTARAFMRDVDTAKRNTDNEVRDLERDKLNFLSAQKGANMASRSSKSAGFISGLGGLASDAAGIYADIEGV